MTSEFKRTDRISEIILRKLSQIIPQEVKDPRLPTFITLSAVNVSADLKFAKVYFTAFSDNIEQVTEILNSASGYLRTALARTIKFRTVPQLQFIYDESIEYGERLSRLIDKVTPSDSDDSEE